jgi:16S rRNA (adenine1518-N6/adenine1519-N6)-dimethyltransferase
MPNRPPCARKRLGQHFLVDPNVLRRIVGLADLTQQDLVCEIGPGGGALTALLCRAAGRVLALEVDSRMVEFLREELGENPNVEIQERDALRFPFEHLPESTVVVANLPYNISTPILFRLLEGRTQIRRMVLTLQLEVAQRLVAKPGTKQYGVLTVLAQHVADVRFGFKVSPKCFRPVPDVDSGVVRLDIRHEDSAVQEDMAPFQVMVRSAFGHRRKTLFNAFRSSGVSAERLHHVQQVSGISLARRAETLTVQEFRVLNHAFCGTDSGTTL